MNSPLQARTWKRLDTAADGLFAFNHLADGQIYMEAYDLCTEADGATAGSTVTLAACSDSQNQLFQSEGRLLRLGIDGQPVLWLAVNPGDGIPTGGPSHIRRDMTLESCDSVDSELAQWITGIFDY